MIQVSVYLLLGETEANKTFSCVAYNIVLLKLI